MHSTIQSFDGRRQAFTAFVAIAACVLLQANAGAQEASGIRMPSSGLASATGQPQLRHLTVPPAHARAIANTLSIRYRDLPGITITQAANQEQIVVMAPARAQAAIAQEVQSMIAGAIQKERVAPTGPLKHRMQNITWREFERDLKQAMGNEIPTTTQQNGNVVTYQMNVAPLQGTLVQVDRRQNLVTIKGPEPHLGGWQKLLSAVDSVPNRYDDITRIYRLKHAEIAPVQKTVRLLKALPASDRNGGVFRSAVFQANQDAGQSNDAAAAAAAAANQIAEAQAGGVLGDVQIQYVPELGQIILKGSTRDVNRVMELIEDIEAKARLTQPDIEVVTLEHADANAVASLLAQLYDDILSSRLGDVSITSLDSPNSLLLIGRTEAITSLKELIGKIDLPVEAASRLRVFRLQNASAVDAETAIRDFFTDRPGTEDDLRPGIGPRVRVLADYRTNSLVISASPRDMTEVTRLIEELDVKDTPATSELKVFTLNNASAEDLAVTLQDAFIGAEITGSENVSAPSTSLKIVAVDGDGRRVVESGILAGATVTADAGANAIVVRAPSSSMPLIAELIRQLDKAPGVDSLVKVFTIENGDATQLTTALETLFGTDAGIQGTQVGAANLAGLPTASASPESTLVPLRFSTDIRTNSIIASGAASDLDVVESILLRLDSEGFAERITEVIWLRNNDAPAVAQAITDYVDQRRQSQTQIQQYQQGLGPYDLLDRDLVAIAEINTNSILLSVAPRLYEEVRALIDRLDRRRPMVLIKVLLAEVSLDDAFEIGTELGLQDSLVFSRGQAIGTGGSIGAGTNGFNFNNAGVQNVNDFARGSVAATTVSTFGLGQSNQAIGFGGFVLNAASESVSLLFRTLQSAGRAQILSRPQLMTIDGTESLINVGRQIARFRGSTVTNNNVTQDIEDITVGLTLRVTPRVSQDGLVTVFVEVTRSDRDVGTGTIVTDGAGGTVLIEDIIDTTAQTTVSVLNGQTVVLGGLIQKNRSQFSRRLPYISNIPLIGNLFKYDFESETRTETLVVMTPMVVSGEQDLEYVKQTESSRMSWCLADVVEAHGDVGLNGGYGLWGPAIGPTIYPDAQPTVDGEVVIGDVPQGLMTDQQHGSAIQSAPIQGTAIQGNAIQGSAIEGRTVQPPMTATEGVLELPSPNMVPGDVPAVTAPANGAPTIIDQSSSRGRGLNVLPATWRK